MHLLRNLTLFILPLLVAPTFAAAADPSPAEEWPGWRGANRTGLSTETGLLAEWGTDGPKLAWKIAGLGDGFSTPSIAGNRIYLLGSKGKDEYLICLSLKDGERLWDVKIGVQAGGHPGPRSTPTIDGSFAYTVSSNGKLVCVELAKGTLVWNKDFKTEFGGKHGSWAYAESPLIDGPNLICTPGGESASVVALKKADGAVVWKTAVGPLPGKAKRAYHVAGYSSPVLATLGGKKQYVQFLDGGVIGVDAADGKLLWHYDAPANGTANCSTPIVRGEYVFAASAYGNGGGQAKITRDGDTFKAEETYFVKKMQNHHGGMVLVKDHVYGTNNGSLLCVEFQTGKIAWENRSVGKGSVVFADGHLYVRGESGSVALVEATPEAYREKGKFAQPERSKQPAWPHPVVLGGKLLLRDWDQLFVYDVKK